MAYTEDPGVSRRGGGATADELGRRRIDENKGVHCRGGETATDKLKETIYMPKYRDARRRVGTMTTVGLTEVPQTKLPPQSNSHGWRTRRIHIPTAWVRRRQLMDSKGGRTTRTRPSITGEAKLRLMSSNKRFKGRKTGTFAAEEARRRSRKLENHDVCRPRRATTTDKYCRSPQTTC